jgi:hypothetical protein
VEARGRDPGGENLGEGNARRGSATGARETAASAGTDSLDAQTLGAAAGVAGVDFGWRRRRRRNSMKGRMCREAHPLLVREIL